MSSLPARPGDLSLDQATLLQSWIDGASEPEAWVEVYRASHDGFGADDFHAKCDNKQRLLVLVKEAEAGWLFGGYTAVGFLPARGGNWYYGDPHAFLFSLTNPSGRPERLASKFTGHDVWYRSDLSACFGANGDFLLRSRAERHKDSHTCPGSAFEAPSSVGCHPMAQGEVMWRAAEVIAWTVTVLPHCTSSKSES